MRPNAPAETSTDMGEVPGTMSHRRRRARGDA